jgi:hypothetical protein
MSAERVISWNLTHFEADLGLKPYSLLIDESDDYERGVAHKSSQMRDIVEPLLAGSSQNSKAMKTFETRSFVFSQRRTHQRFPIKPEE